MSFSTDLAAAVKEDPLSVLTEDDLDTILAIAANGQSGRITEFEIKALVAAFREKLQTAAPAA